MNLWLPASYESQLARSAPPVPDLAPFVRANLSLGALQGTVNVLEGWALAQAMRGVDPRTVPLSALQSMGTHPIVYLAERAIGGIVRRPDLYYVRHSDRTSCNNAPRRTCDDEASRGPRSGDPHVSPRTTGTAP